MNIYIMDPSNLDKLAVLNTYTARQWDRYWAESGEFKIWAPITDENAEFLVEENLVWPDDQLLVGVIETVNKYTDDETGLPLMEISGRFVESSYLSRRIIWGNALITDTPANIIQRIVRGNAIAATDTNRKLGDAVWGTMTISSSVPSQSNITYCNSYGNLWEEVKKLCLKYGMNVEFRYYNNGTLITIFGVISGGYNRTSSVNLSTDLGFLTDSSYLWDSTDYCNTALVAGEGEGADRTTVSIIPSTAIQRARRELYVDARDLQKDSASTQDPMTDEEYAQALTERGQKKLLDYPLYESYECSLQLTGEEGYVFGTDYNLGDLVTLTDNVLKVQVQARVKEHHISEDKEGRVDTLVFGLAVPTITSLVKRRD